MPIIRACFLVCGVFAALSSCTPIPSADDQLQMISRQTGFAPLQVEGATADYLSKHEGGYQLLLRVRGGNVWGRYAARMAAGEIGRELGGIWSFLTGSYKSGVGSITGSPFDRVLSDLIGQPISLSVILHHNKKTSARLDVVNMFSVLRPPDPQSEIAYIGLGAGTLYSSDAGLAKRVLDNGPLIDKIKNFRSQYLRLDADNISFLFAGSENDYSAMIRDNGGYASLLNNISSVLITLADEL